jgi:beta-lactam-binding protein with PASTA domain
VVPNVIHQALAKARAKIRSRHCGVGKITRKASTPAMKGRVLSQQPKGSSKKRRRGFKVNLTVGTG